MNIMKNTIGASSLTETEKKKVSEFLSELDDHAILDSTAVSIAFEKETSYYPRWSSYTKKQMQARIDVRGKGGEVKGPDDLRFVGALDVAEWCAREFVSTDFHHDKFGMGSAFRACVEAISEAGY